MNQKKILLLLATGILSALPFLPAQETDLVLPSMLLEASQAEGPQIKDLTQTGWEATLPDAAFTLPSPAPLAGLELESLLDSPASLLPTGTPVLPPDWNLLTSLGMTLGAPYQFGAEANLLRLGKNLPFRLNFSHRTVDSFWDGSGFLSPGSGYSDRSTRMNFDVAGDPSRTWYLILSLREDSAGLQQKAAGYHSAEYRKAQAEGLMSLPLNSSWSLAAGMSAGYSQRVLAGITPRSATLAALSLTPKVLWNLGDLGKTGLDLQGNLKNLNDRVLWSGGARIDFQLYPFPGWTFKGDLGASGDPEGWLFPGQGTLLWYLGPWSGSLEGGFHHSRPWNRWESGPWSSLEIPLVPEASGWGGTQIRWNWSAQGWTALKASYQGGWLYENGPAEGSTSLFPPVLKEANRWKGSWEFWYRLAELWNNALVMELSTGYDVQDPFRGEWTTELQPGPWKLSHRLEGRFGRTGAIPRGDLVLEVVPSPLLTVRAGMEDWTSLFMDSGRKSLESGFLEPGFRLFLTGKLNI